MTKCCIICHQDKALSDFPSRRKQCRNCVNKRRQARHAANREEYEKKTRAYNKLHRAEQQAKQNAARHADPEKFRQRERVSRLKNVGKAREKDRAVYAATSEKCRARTRACNAKNREKRLAYSRDYEARHLEARRKKARHYIATHPEIVRKNNALRQARKRGASNGIAIRHRDIAERDGWRCHICGGKVTQKEWSLDHLIPLSAGGPHIPTNVALAHRRCNSIRGIGKRIPAQLLLIG